VVVEAVGAEAELGGSLLQSGRLRDVSDFNQAIIDEFRANEGKVGGGFAGAPMILVHHKGAKSGTQRVSPLVYQGVGDAFAVFGSRGGAPKDPAWVANLRANPDTVVEVGAETIKVRARILEGDEREPIWAKQKELMPGFAEYERKAAASSGRQIPVILLERR
jgi:deazaflavin-dependent oxidoreductase (nitroreductase family)